MSILLAMRICNKMCLDLVLSLVKINPVDQLFQPTRMLSTTYNINQNSILMLSLAMHHQSCLALPMPCSYSESESAKAETLSRPVTPDAVVCISVRMGCVPIVTNRFLYWRPLLTPKSGDKYPCFFQFRNS